MIKALKALLKGSPSEANEDQGHYALPALALLVETAKADHSLDDEELVRVIELAESHFAVSDEESAVLMDLAREQTDSATSLYEFTSIINEHYSDNDKYALVLAMWEIAYVDGRIDRYEEHLIRKVAELIYVPHVKFIEAKHSARSAAGLDDSGGSLLG